MYLLYILHSDSWKQGKDFFFFNFRPQEHQRQLHRGSLVLWPQWSLAELLQLHWCRRRLQQLPSSTDLPGETPNPLNRSLHLIWNTPDGWALTVVFIQIQNSAVAVAQSVKSGAEEFHGNITGNSTKSTRTNIDFQCLNRKTCILLVSTYTGA